MSVSSRGNHINPPRWADKFLEWYCNPTLLEEIQGDAHELFYRTVKNNRPKARLRFIWNVIRFLRWRNFRKDRIIKPSATRDMIQSYFISGIRNMIRNATPSFINITGLSLAISVAVTVFILEDSFYDLDSMHTKSDRIALVVNKIKSGDETYKNARSPYPLAEILKENTAVEMISRAGRTSANIRVDDKVFLERIFFADPEFMKMFDFNVLVGDRNALVNKNQLLISEDIAIKYYGNTDVVGKPMSIKFNDDKKLKYEFSIGGVLENTPANSSMYIDIMVPASVWVEMNKNNIDDWSKLLSSNFILKKDGSDWSSLDSDLESFKKFQNQADPIRAIQSSYLLPLKEVAPASWDISGSLSWSNSPEAMIAISIIGILLLLLASFNYMNVAVASVTTRLKEIGIRKVIGGGKRDIIFQFLLENVVLCFIALCIGTIVAYYFFVPGFNQLFPIKIAFAISSWKMAIGFFGGLLLIIALLSGAYPSIYAHIRQPHAPCAQHAGKRMQQNRLHTHRIGDSACMLPTGPAKRH
jgi:ABC-type antimicrobial peptide transport system permease subunit